MDTQDKQNNTPQNTVDPVTANPVIDTAIETISLPSTDLPSLAKRLAELETIVYNHKHRQFDATKILTINDSDITFTDITTGNVSITKHGFAPKAPNDTTKFLRGDATWAAPSTGYAGYVNVGDSSPISTRLPSGWSSAVDDAGKPSWAVTHNLGTANYTVVVTSSYNNTDNTSEVIQEYMNSRDTNKFAVKFLGVGGSGNTLTSFSFILYLT